MKPNKYSDMFLVQNKLIASQNRMFGDLAKICGCHSKKIMKIQKNHIYLTKYQKLTTNYWYLLKGKLFLDICGKNCIQNANVRVHQPLYCSCVYWKIRPIITSKIRAVNHKNLASYIFCLITEAITTQAINISNLK